MTDTYRVTSTTLKVGFNSCHTYHVTSTTLKVGSIFLSCVSRDFYNAKGRFYYSRNTYHVTSTTLKVGSNSCHTYHVTSTTLKVGSITLVIRIT